MKQSKFTLFIIGIAGLTTAQTAHCTAAVKIFENNNGKYTWYPFKEKANFTTDSKYAVFAVTWWLVNGKEKLILKNNPYGTHAISSHHHENNNGNPDHFISECLDKA